MVPICVGDLERRATGQKKKKRGIIIVELFEHESGPPHKQAQCPHNN